MDEASQLRRFHRVILTAGLATLAIYAVAVAIVLWFFRGEVQRQILQRDGTLLTSVSQHFHDRLEPGDGFDLLEVALESSDISGVIAVRLYAADGELLGKVPASVYEVGLPAADLRELLQDQPITRHFKEFVLETLFSDRIRVAEQAHPVTEVLVPVKDAAGLPVAIIQYWLDGEAVAAELAQLDQFLVGLGGVFILAGGLIFLLVFLYARNRLLSMGRLLAQRNQSLEQANRELALAARTSAIGSVTGHLFHGLKNPLAGLKSYLRLIVRDEEAVALTDHMQSLIDETLGVLREEGGPPEVDLSFAEFMDMVGARFNGRNGGPVEVSGTGAGSIPARKAQLCLLVLRNLVDNALEAAPAGRPVRIRSRMHEHSLVIDVEDSGPGLPDHIRQHLFEPVTSNKANGTGIGLAISSVIARHIPARLQLSRTGPQGTIFTLEIPT